MGNWTIVIQGTGQHHNFEQDADRKVTGQDPKDADKMARRFVQDLKAAGQNVEHATITHGGRDQAMTLVDVLDQ